MSGSSWQQQHVENKKCRLGILTQKYKVRTEILEGSPLCCTQEPAPAAPHNTKQPQPPLVTCQRARAGGRRPGTGAEAPPPGSLTASPSALGTGAGDPPGLSGKGLRPDASEARGEGAEAGDP